MTPLFRHGHATHPDWRIATELVLAQLGGQAKDPQYAQHGQLGIVYVTLPFVEALPGIATLLRMRTQVLDWVGTSAPMIVATGVEYVDEPAISVLVVDAPAGSTRVFSGRQPLPGLDQLAPSGAALMHSALVHADAFTPDLSEVISDMGGKTIGGHIFGGIGSGASHDPQSPRPQLANQTFYGGVSGAIFAADVPVITRVTQGCSPLGPEHVVSRSESNYLHALDDQPALDVMLRDLQVDEPTISSQDGDTLLSAIPRETLRQGLMIATAAPTPAGVQRTPQGFADFSVRQVLGIDPKQRYVATASEPLEGERLVFCTRSPQSARKDLLRICSELREECDARGARIRGAVYVSCTARGQHSFGEPSAEIGLIHSQLGEFPLTGFFANGEIAFGRLFGFTGVLTLFL